MTTTPTPTPRPTQLPYWTSRPESRSSTRPWHVSKPPALKGHALQAPILVMQLAKFQTLEKGTAADAAQAWWRTMFLGAGEDDSLRAPPAGFFKW